MRDAAADADARAARAADAVAAAQRERDAYRADHGAPPMTLKRPCFSCALMRTA